MELKYGNFDPWPSLGKFSSVVEWWTQISQVAGSNPGGGNQHQKKREKSRAETETETKAHRWTDRQTYRQKKRRKTEWRKKKEKLQEMFIDGAKCI